MRTLKPLPLAFFALLTAVFLMPATPATAQVPAYLHALSNLRQARALLQADRRPTFQGHLNAANLLITQAITKLKVAVKEEGVSPYQTPPPQSAGDPNGAVHEALRLLHDAHDDIGHEREPPAFPGLQAGSLHLIEDARHELQQIVNNQ